MKSNIEYGRLMKAYINKYGCTKVELAKRIGVSRFVVANILSLRNKVTLPQTAEKIDAFFKDGVI